MFVRAIKAILYEQSIQVRIIILFQITILVHSIMNKVPKYSSFQSNFIIFVSE